MTRYLLLLGLILIAGQALFASGLDATATYTASLVSPGVYQYDLTLNNIGTTTIGTFWFSWIPDLDFMPANPTNITSPANWQDFVTTLGPPDGFAILWTANSPADELAAGSSLSGFSFDSTMTPAQLVMASTQSPSDPVATAFAYIGAPFGDPGLKFVATAAVTTATPEPATTVSTALGFGLIALFSYLFRKPMRSAKQH